jgi:hypothetical protein
VRQRQRADAARRDAHGDGPAVIDRRRLCQRHLPHHLHPHVQSGVGVLPFLVRQRGPHIRGAPHAPSR